MSTGIALAGGRRASGQYMTPRPVTNMASVASMNGAPRMAPTPISCAGDWPRRRAPANRIATSGIIVSGSAVPTAARTLPTAPSARFSLWPNHSMPLVNSSARDQDDDERDDELEELHQLASASVSAGSMCRSTLGAQVLWRVGQQGHVAGALERDGQLALVLGARAGLAARLDLGALRQVAAEAVDLLVVDLRVLSAQKAHTLRRRRSRYMSSRLAAASAGGGMGEVPFVSVGGRQDQNGRSS